MSDRFNWKIVWAAFLVALFGWGFGFYGPPVFLQMLHAQRGWSVSAISSAITFHFVFSAILIVYLPDAYRRFGLPRVTAVGLVAAAAGVLSWSLAQQPWHLFIAALVSGAGWATLSGAAINAIVTPWFDRDRPKALSTAFNGASCGGLLFTPLWVLVISQFGFTAGAALIGLGMLAIMLPVTAMIIGRNAPLAVAANAAPGRSRGQLFRDRGFFTISIAFALALFAQVGIVAHLIARLAPEFGTTGGAWAMSFVTLCAMAGRSVIGAVMGERNRRVVAAANFAIQALGTLLFTFGDGPVPLLLGCALFGFGFGNLVSLPPLLLQREFSGAEVGRAVALIVAVNQAVFAFAPAVLGILRDLAGDYTVSFALAATLQGVAAAVVLLGRVSLRPKTLG